MNSRHSNSDSLPVAIIGAGPVGLAAAAHLRGYGVPFTVLEAGDRAGAAIRQWGHVQIFTPWRLSVDRVGTALLARAGWQPPPDEELPTGNALVERYLTPLSQVPELEPHIRYGARVMAVGRKDSDKVRTVGRDMRPFELRLADGSVILARAVIDASGTWGTPNPMGSGGYPVPGEIELAHRIDYGIPDVLGARRERYAGRRVLVVGSGHSAINTVLDLLELQDSAPDTSVIWAIRRENPAHVFGGEERDELPARGALGQRAREAVAARRLEVLVPFRVRAVLDGAERVRVSGLLDEQPHTVAVDRIVVATGLRPQLDMLREVRIGLDPWLESVQALAPLIDPNVHSCGTVPAHGAAELAHPERDFFIIGMKSYGRAPTFLMATGYEQARSVAAWLADDFEAARRVELQLPETGVCEVPLERGGALACCGGRADTDSSVAPAACCGGPAPAGTDGCCARDAHARAIGEAGCGCEAA